MLLAEHRGLLVDVVHIFTGLVVELDSFHGQGILVVVDLHAASLRKTVEAVDVLPLHILHGVEGALVHL